MFGGDNSNAVFPAIFENNRYQSNANVSPQLQLFENLPVGCTFGHLNHVGNEHTGPLDRLNKRGREIDLVSQPLGHLITLNNKFGQEEAGQSVNPVSTGLRLSCEEDEHHSTVTSVCEGMTAALPILLSCSNNLKAEIDWQKEEFDRFIKIQEENIMKGINELRQRHTASFLSVIEKEIVRKLKEKEIEIETLNRKNRVLIEKIKQAGVELQTWHYKAMYNESVVNALKNNLQQIMAQGVLQRKEGCGESEVDDAASYTNLNHLSLVNGLENLVLMSCKACKIREICVLLLPCRHLCLCKDCEGFINICPLCGVMKTASVQVYMS